MGTPGDSPGEGKGVPSRPPSLDGSSNSWGLGPFLGNKSEPRDSSCLWERQLEHVGRRLVLGVREWVLRPDVAVRVCPRSRWKRPIVIEEKLLREKHAAHECEL